MINSYDIEVELPSFNGLLNDYLTKKDLLNSKIGELVGNEEVSIRNGYVDQVDVNNLVSIVFYLTVDTSHQFKEVKTFVVESVRKYCQALGVPVVDNVNDIDLTLFKYYTLIWDDQLKIRNHSRLEAV